MNVRQEGKYLWGSSHKWIIQNFLQGRRLRTQARHCFHVQLGTWPGSRTLAPYAKRKPKPSFHETVYEPSDDTNTASKFQRSCLERSAGFRYVHRGIKVKLSLCLTKHHAMKTYCEMEILHAFDLGTDRGEW